MVVWAIADRFLDIVGLGTLLYWTVKGTKWVMRRSPPSPSRPRATRLNRSNDN